MDTLIVLLIVLFAAGFLGRRVARSWQTARAASSGCASDCGCGPSAGKRPKSWDHTPAA